MKPMQPDPVEPQPTPQSQPPADLTGGALRATGHHVDSKARLSRNATPPSDAAVALMAQAGAPVLLEPTQPSLWSPVTMLCTLMFFSVVGFRVYTTGQHDRDDFLAAPEEYLERVMGRDLDAEEYAAKMPAWISTLNNLQGYKPGDTLNSAINAYIDFVPKSTWLRPNRTLVILLGESERLDEAEEELDILAADEAEADFIAAVRFAYWDEEFESPPPFDKAVALVHPQWARDKLIVRVSEKLGDIRQADDARSRLEARGRHAYEKSTPLLWGPILFIAATIVVIAGWSVAGFPSTQLGDGFTVSPWSLGRGAAVMVRAALVGVVVAEIVGSYVEDAWVLYGFASLLQILPLLWFGSRYLVRPWNLTLASCFGLTVPFRRWGGLLLFTIALAGIDQIGSMLISALTTYLGCEAHWAEIVFEDYLWKPWYVVSLDFLDGVVWAPISEEIGCRGFLYTTLRRKLPMLPAAALTGIIFGAAHLYSLSGFLMVTWSGFLWSVAYEKSRSLLPGMISHSAGNWLALGGQVLAYRA